MHAALCLVLTTVVSAPALAQDTEPAPAVDSEDLEELEGRLADAEAALEERLADAEARMEEQAEALEAQQAELEAQRHELAAQKSALIPKDDLEIELEGYFRTRGYVFNNLFDGQKKDARYLQSRLRLQPTANYRDLAKLSMEFNALDDVVWGDNASLASTALFAGSPSYTDIDGQETPTVALSRVWTEVTVPAGVLRVGRQASHWGMGLLANDGNGFDDTFGENHYGATYDRVLFATRPIALGQAIAGKEDNEIPFYVAVGVDRLVEDPLFQYYGYRCEAGLVNGQDDGYDPRCDPDGDGVSDLDHSFVDEDRVSGDRTTSWWADQDDDVMEMIYVAIYRGEGVNLFGTTGDLTAGTYVVNRIQRETDSKVWIADAYLKSRWRSLALEFEGLTIMGDTSAIALPGSYDPSDDSADPLAKTAGIWGYVARAGYVRSDWSAWMEHGFASGDDYVADKDFTGRALHPDHNVGLLLYEEVIARVTSQIWGDAGRGLWSNGGVYNSRYIFPNVRVSPVDDWEVIGAFLGAWPHKPDGAFILCKDGDDVDCSLYDATASMLGWEVDLAVKHRWHEHVLFSLEGGYARATDRLPLEVAGLNPDGGFFTVQSRLAFEL